MDPSKELASKGIYHSIAEHAVRWRLFVIFVWMSLLVAIAAGASRTTTIVDLDLIMPQDHRLIRATKDAEAIFGGKYPAVFVVAAETGSKLTPEAISVVRGITDELESSPYVLKTTVLSLTASRVKSISGGSGELVVQPFFKRGDLEQADVQSALAKLESSSPYRSLLVSPTGEHATVFADFKKDESGFRNIKREIERIARKFEQPEVSIRYTGQPIYNAIIEEYSDRMGVLLPLAILVIGLIHWEAFRSGQSLAFPLLTGILAMIFPVGIFGWLEIPLDPFMAVAPILVLAIAAGHAVQVLKRYYEEYVGLLGKGSDPGAEASKVATIRAVSLVAPVTVAAGLVGAISFATLLAFPLESIRLFGLFVSIGILVSVMIELTLIPAVRSLAPPPSSAHVARERSHGFWDIVIRSAARASSSVPVTVLVLTAVSFVGLVVLALNVRGDNSLRSYFASDVTENVQDAAINENVVGTNVLYVWFQTEKVDGVFEPEVFEGLKSIQSYLDGRPDVTKTLSIANFIADINDALNFDTTAAKRVALNREQLIQSLALYSLSSEPTDFDKVIDATSRNARIVAFMSTDSTVAVREIEHDVGVLAEPLAQLGIAVRVGGPVTTPQALDEVMVQGKIQNIAQILVATLIVSALLFKSFTTGVLVIVPLTFSVLAVFGAMGAVGIPMQVPTATIAAIAVGIGGDFAIYLLFRIREEFGRTGDWVSSIHAGVMSAGAAVMFVSTAVALGYGVLMLSFGFHVHVWMGMLVAIAMFASVAAALLALPSAVSIWKESVLTTSR